MRTHRTLFVSGATAILATLAGCAVPADGSPASTDPVENHEASPWRPAATDGLDTPRRTTRGQLIGVPALEEEGIGSVEPAPPAAVGSGEETCNGELVAVELGSSIPITGTTIGKSDDITSWCGDTTADIDMPDVVYMLDVQDAGTLEIRVSGVASFKPAFQLHRGECTVDGNYDHCIDTSTALTTLKGHFDVGVYYLVIDGTSATMSGDFTAQVSLTASICGDRVVGPGEACDLGDEATNDGCNASCQFEAAGGADTCDGAEAVDITAGIPEMITAHTIGFTDDYQGSASCTYDLGGRDRVYAVRPLANGTLKATIGKNSFDIADCNNAFGSSCWDRVLYIREGSCAGGTELDCSDDPLDGAAIEQIEIPVTANTVYWLFVDGFDDAFYSFGDFTLKVELN